MAQNFRRITAVNIGTSAVDFPDGSNFPSGYHTLIGIRICNTSASTVNVSAYINNGSANIYIQKSPTTIAPGAALELIDGASKIVVQSGDRLYIQSSAASSLDAWVSYVQDIST